jgi:hypothetical protein
MKKIVKLTEKDLESIVNRVITESPEFGNFMGRSGMLDYKTIEPNETKNYMFFQNLKEIKENIDTLLSMEETMIDDILSDGHGWALEHIATAKDDIEEVTSFLKHR